MVLLTDAFEKKGHKSMKDNKSTPVKWECFFVISLCFLLRGIIINKISSLIWFQTALLS